MSTILNTTTAIIMLGLAATGTALARGALNHSQPHPGPAALPPVIAPPQPLTPQFNNPGPQISIPQISNPVNQLSPLPCCSSQPDALGIR
jgi:hypothetical protein